MVTDNKVWMGIGLYPHYVDNLREYALELSSFSGEVKFILGDEIQKYNVLINADGERERIQKELEDIGSKLEQTINGFRLQKWNFLSENQRYQHILESVNQLYQTEPIFNHQVKRLTANKTKVELINPNIDTLAGYTLEETASIYFFAEQGYIKAGHQGERDYDKLAIKTLKRYPKKLRLRINPEQLEFIYLDYKSTKNKLFFNRHSDEYDLHMELSGHYAAQRKLLHQVSLYIKEPILDLACGTGMLLKWLSVQFSEIHGNDFSKTMLVKAQQLVSAMSWTNNNATTLRSHRVKYGTLICCNLFFYLLDYHTALSKWRELLSDDGTLLVMEEEPFVYPQQLSWLEQIVHPLPIAKVRDIFKIEGYNLMQHEFTAIDQNHDLHILIFK